jgi:hypothetical protein
MIHILQKLEVFCTKNAKDLGENILNSITSVTDLKNKLKHEILCVRVCNTLNKKVPT